MERRMNKVRETGWGRGFTLIEIMVVVGIIVLLMAILLPALSGAKKQGYISSTNALMAGIQNNITQYQLDFGAFPGPISERVLGGATGKQICGSQNMFVGLSRRWQTNTTGLTTYSTFNITGNDIYVDTTGSATPLDNSVMRSFKPYYTPKPDELGVLSGTSLAAPGSTFPLVVDKFPDGLPILYYRATPGMEKSSGGFVAMEDSSSAAPFYLNSNVELTGTSSKAVNLISTKGAPFSQKLDLADLRKMVGTGDGSANSGVAGGGFVLISAGADRTFGKKNGVIDDIILFGGS